MNAERARGQALVLFALMLIALLGFAALAIDVSSVYSEIRFERSVADSASLAGASDTYRQGSNTVAAPEWQNARTHAMQNLIDELDGTYAPGDPLPTCAGQTAPYANNIVNCLISGTPYYVSISAPGRTCVTIGGCDPLRSVQVTVRNPSHGMTFARLFGQGEWNLPVTSVAERNRGTNYSFVTLRPPKPSRANSSWCTPNCDANDDDILLDGTNTRLTVLGDMGTNTNMDLKAGATVVLTEPGSKVDRYDAYKLWSGPPADRQIPQPIPDPSYPIPVRPTDANLIYGSPATAHMNATDCAVEVAKVPGTYGVNAAGIATGEVICLKPGRYTYAPSGTGYSAVRTYIMSPGVYYFDRGFQPGNNVRVIGGYEPGQPGVALVFRDGGACPFAGGCDFAGNALNLLSLNAGNAYPSGTGTPAKAARNWDGTVVQTTARVPVLMSLIVEKDAACVVASVDICGSNANQNKQLALPGGGSIFVFGVQYAPTDNVAITGGSGTDGYLGQIWAWTVQYTGGSNINLVGVQNPEPGVLRIATPCSPSAQCDNPEAGAAIP
jgi:Putative Flp pilus-assembly TadE/G-like